MAVNAADAGCIVIDAHKQLCMVEYALRWALSEISPIEGAIDTSSAVYALDNEASNVLWGALDTIRQVRDSLDVACGTI